jgi:hypothetical protein
VLYAGPLGHHSQKLIDYFEAVEGVPKIKDGINPSTWMLEVTSQASEQKLDVTLLTFTPSPHCISEYFPVSICRISLM